jgi:hypothetical protein
LPAHLITNKPRRRRRRRFTESVFTVRLTWGANVYQNRGGDRTFTDDNPNSPFFGDTLTVSPKNDVGLFGGIKLGYVFGTGVVRPTIEGDFFYNGFRGGANFTLRDSFSDVLAQRNVTTWINTGAFMGNFILRFAPGNEKFQPYVGAGVGVYYAESAGVQVQDPVTGQVPINTGGGEVMPTWHGKLSQAQITIGLRSLALLLNTSSWIIRALKSIPVRAAIWASN